MRKPELVAAIAESAGLSRRQADQALDAALEHITNALSRGEDVAIGGFGSFNLRERAARPGRNPQTGETIVIPAARGIGFRPAKALRETVAGA